MLPNKVGPIVVFATPTAPQGILQESFLSLPGVGVRLMNPVKFYWRLVIFPCAALSATLPALSVVGAIAVALIRTHHTPQGQPGNGGISTCPRRA